MSEMTAIELLERDKWMLITLRDFYKQWLANAKANEIDEQINQIDAYLSSSPSERAKELVEDIRRTDADEAWHLTFDDATHEIEEYAYAKNEELCKIMDEYENVLSDCKKALNTVESLIKESRGVYGLHLNGDPSPWEELRTGGCFEDWLIDFDTALSELNKAGIK